MTEENCRSRSILHDSHDGDYADEPFEDTLRDLRICAVQQKLTLAGRELFSTALWGSAYLFFLNKCTSYITFKEIVYRNPNNLKSEAKGEQI